MYWNVTAIDRATLPAALLTTVKAHCRVDFPDDDEILKTYTAISIAQLENVWDLAVFGVTGDWQPTPDAVTGQFAYETPVQPADTFVAKDGDGTDVSTEYTLLHRFNFEMSTVFMKKDQTPIESDIVVTLKGGYTAVADLPPEMTGAILQVTARLYEYRESTASFSVQQMPMWMNDIMVGLWRPRA